MNPPPADRNDASSPVGRSARHGVLRWLLPLLRYGLCVVAIAYLVHVVPWRDQVRLAGGGEQRYPVLGHDGERLIIERDGRRQTVAPDDVAQIEVGAHHMPDIEQGIPTVVRQMNMMQAFWAVFMFFPVPLMAALRLVWMLAIQDVRLSLWNATKLTFAGNFFNFALPGMTGGDVIKAYYITRYTPLKTEAVTTIFLDRVIGLLSLVIMAGIMILATQDLTQFRQLMLVLAVICGGLALAAIPIFSSRLRRALRLSELAARLPMGAILVRVGRATVAMRHHKMLVFLSLVLTFVLQGIAIVSVAVMAWALNMQGSFAFYFIYVAIGFLVAAIPISPPQAVGVLEYFYVLFFTQVEPNTASQAVALAVASRLIQLVWSLPGVLVPLLGAHLPSKTELAALEGEAAASAVQP